ncbi:MAG: ATP-binding protein [Anaerolineae bacterium]|nr:ATP-binding protein [Anaerolineae bacterium]
MVTIPVIEEHHIAQARQAAAALAEEIGFKRVLVYYVATSVSELANNLFFHTPRGGRVTLTALRREGEVGIEVVAEDDGPGIPDVALALQDGFSTSGGLGGGLPGVERLMDEFEITSAAGAGTRVVARKWQPCG